MSWHSIALGNVVDVAAGQAAPPADAFEQAGKPFIRAGSVDGLMTRANWSELEHLSEASAQQQGMKLFPADTVLFAKSGMSAALGRVFKTDRPAYVVSHLAALKPTGKADPAFLTHWLAYFGTNRLIKDPAYPSIRLADVEEMPFPAISLPEQRRIAAILDRADALRRLRRQSLSCLSDLGRAIFFEMFVNGSRTNEPPSTVEDVVNHTKGGIRTGPFGSQLLHSEFVDEGIAVLGIDNAVANEFRWAKPRHITPEKYRSLKRYKVHPGDVLITIMGTCGRCAIVPADVGEAINTKHLCCISLDLKRCAPEFLHAYFLHHPTARHYLSLRSKGAIMDGLNMGIIKELPVQLPLIDKQHEFSRKLAQLQQPLDSTAAALIQADNLFASLQHRAFRGEL